MNRITDRFGHRWPITGTWCPVCDMPTDPSLDGGPHPTCNPVDSGVYDHAPGRWRISGEPVRVLRPHLLAGRPGEHDHHIGGAR